MHVLRHHGSALGGCFRLALLRQKVIPHDTVRPCCCAGRRFGAGGGESRLQSRSCAGDTMGIVTGVFFRLYFLAVGAARLKSGAARVTFEMSLITAALLSLSPWSWSRIILPKSAMLGDSPDARLCHIRRAVAALHRLGRLPTVSRRWSFSSRRLPQRDHRHGSCSMSRCRCFSAVADSSFSAASGWRVRRRPENTSVSSSSRPLP